MSEDLFSAAEKAQAIAAMQAVGTAQQNATLLLKRLRGQCKQHGMDAQFLEVQFAFVEAERIVGQELQRLKGLVKPLPTPAQALDTYREDVAAGEPENEVRQELEHVHAAWRAPQMRAAGDHSFEDVQRT